MKLRRKNRIPDPNIPIDFEPSHFMAVVNDGILYEDIYLTEDFFIRAIILTQKGIFFVIPGKARDITPILETFEMTKENAYFFFVDEEQVTLSLGSESIEIDDIYEAFQNLYENLDKPITASLGTLSELIERVEEPETEETPVSKDFQYEGIAFTMENPFSEEKKEEVRGDNLSVRIDQATFDRLNQKFADMEGNERPDPYAKKKIGDDGYLYVKKYAERKIGGFDTGLIGKEKWFRMSDENTDGYIVKTALLGWAGGHKFMHGEIISGILYLLSCGCIGVLPAMDILLSMFGNASYSIVTYENGETLTRTKERIYLDKPKHMIVGILGIIASLGIGYLMFRYVYSNLFQMLGGAIGNVMEQMNETTAAAGNFMN